MNDIAVQFLLSVAAGVAATLSAALLVFGWNWIRNKRLERRLKDVFTVNAAGVSKGGFHIALTNRSWVPVTVRQVRMYFEQIQTAVDFPFAEFAPYEFDGDSNLATGEDGIQVMSEMHEAPNDPSPLGFVTLPPGVGGRWKMPNFPPSQSGHRTIKDIRAVIEYPTVFGGRREIAVCAKAKSVKWIAEWYREYSNK